MLLFLIFFMLVMYSSDLAVEMTLKIWIKITKTVGLWTSRDATRPTTLYDLC